MAHDNQGARKLIDDILALLARNKFLRDCRVLERDETPGGAILLKARCRIGAHTYLQVWIKQASRGRRYSYQLISNGPILRWDNAPHYSDLENFPHHFHQTRGKPVPSSLSGDVLQDLSFVLNEIEKYIDPQT